MNKPLIFCNKCKWYNDHYGYESCKTAPDVVPTHLGYKTKYHDPAKRNKCNDCKFFEQKVSLIKRLMNGEI